MTNSDIIAIIAIVVSGVTSVVTLIVGYLTTRASHRVDLNKIAYEKRLQAFSDIYSSITELNRKRRYACVFAYSCDRQNANDYEKYIVMIEDVNKSCDDFYLIYDSNRVYLPKDIDDLICSYDERIASRLLPKDFDNLSDKDMMEYYKNEIQLQTETTTDIITAMHKFVGLDQQEIKSNKKQTRLID